MHALHRNFMGEFRPHFRLQKKNPKGKFMYKRDPFTQKPRPIYYTIDQDEEYRDFILSILNVLEPRFEEIGSIIIDENEVVLEMIFIISGQVDIGFMIDRDFIASVQFAQGRVFGAYEMFNSKKSKFQYKCKTRMEGYFIRKSNFMNLQYEFPDVYQAFIQNLTGRYYTRIQITVSKTRQKVLDDLKKRYPNQ